MKKFKKIIVLLILALAFTAVAQPAQVYASTPKRSSCSSTPASGNAFIYVKGKYLKTSASKILKRVNAIRKEACKEGVINPSTGKKLKSSDYVPIKWSSELEKIAQTRAAEASVALGHTRPNGQSCFTVKYDGWQSWGEVLAWNYSGIMQGIEQWYEEKSDWVNQTGAVTGHYTQMIDPENTYIGLGGFDKQTGEWIAVAGEFASNSEIKYMGKTSVSEKQVGVSGVYYQVIEVTKSNLKMKLSSCTLKVGKSKKLSVKAVFTNKSDFGYTVTTKGLPQGKKTWTSSNKSVAKVASDGTVTAKKAGTATITVVTASGKKATCKITVKK